MARIGRILVHDYAGHPYAVQLSRELADKGIEILHVYSSSNPMPKGSLAKSEQDSPTFNVCPISVREKIDKSKFLKRRSLEIQHGRLVMDKIREFKPDVVLSGSTPLDTQNLIWRQCELDSIPTVFWLQDLTGIATELVLGKKLPVIGKLIGRHYRNLEEHLLRSSAGVVAISHDFIPILKEAGVSAERIDVVENWGPIGEIKVQHRENEWAKINGLIESFNFIYTGTLGMKHDPQILVDLCREFKTTSVVKIVVITEGIGRKWLELRKTEFQLENLILLDFQNFDQMEQVMGTADVLVAILEPSAGIFSVPSKVLSYLCASRSLLLSVPPENLAARIVTTCNAGLVAQPGDTESFLRKAKTLHANSDMRAEMGLNGRKYAEETFAITKVGNEFVRIFEKC